MSSSDTIETDIICAAGLGKRYVLYDSPSDRLKELVFGRPQKLTQEFWALQSIDLRIKRGEVVGIIGNNGAGKSTLLQLICGTLKPSVGSLTVAGRVTALLELGAGFNPDFSGRENIFMNAAILGIDRQLLDNELEQIIAFADIGAFIDRPVRTYSSGMFIRLAFAVATSSQPDILIIDEALSVGDGAFARKSFDRIMALKEAGVTILFCSHAMYQVEALCSRALWLEKGRVREDGLAAQVTRNYQASLIESKTTNQHLESPPIQGEVDNTAVISPGNGRFTAIEGHTEFGSGRVLRAHSKKSTLRIDLHFQIDPSLPHPSIALGINDQSNITIASATSFNDGVVIEVNENGRGHAQIVFPNLPLLKGRYFITLFLACERALHIYDQATNYLSLEVSQDGLEQGFVHLPHQWQI